MISLFEPDAAGAAQERLLARARVAMAAASLLALYLDPTEPIRYAGTAYLLLLAYVAASLLYLVVIRGSERRPRWRPAIAHGADILWLALLTSMTGASSSPLFAFFTFIVLAAAIQWGYIETLATMLVILWITVIEGIVLTRFGVFASEFDLNWFLVRLTYMTIAGVLLSYVASYQKQLRLESSLIARVLAKLRSETKLDSAFETAGRELLRACGAKALAIAVRVPSSGETLYWTLDNREAAEIMRGALTPTEADSLLSDGPSAFILKRRRGRVTMTATSRGVVGPRPSAISPTEPFTTALVASASYPEWYGRVFLFDPVRRVRNVAGLQLLARVVEAISPALHTIFLIGRLRSRSEASERARLARELHDTSVQSLIGLEMEVLALSRRTADSTLRSSVTAIHSRLQQEIRGLRNLMVQLGKSGEPTSSVTDRLSEMLAQFQVETSIRTRLVSSAAVAVPPRIGQEILRLMEAALSNVRRHSGATRVDVTLERFADGWKLVIDDDGHGFRASHQPRPSVVTPWSLRERVAALGGELVVDRRKNVGVRVEITLPPFVQSA
ncbi:MAG: sensor histidine kinase [Vicinamibacterales bacterium]